MTKIKEIKKSPVDPQTIIATQVEVIAQKDRQIAQLEAINLEAFVRNTEMSRELRAYQNAEKKYKRMEK